MIRSKAKKNTGVSGLADVRVLANSLRVHFKADDDEYQTSLEGWDREAGLYNVTLEKSNDKVKWVSPPGRPQAYLVKFQEFGNRQNGIPEPKKQEGGPRQGVRKDGTPYSYYQPDSWKAIAKLEVMEQGIYKGLIISHRVPYVFVLDPATNESMIEGTNAERKQTEEFLVINGFDLAQDSIPAATNVLPWLEARIQAAGKLFLVTLNEKGFVDALSPLPAFMDVSSILGKNGKSKAKAPAKVKAKARRK